MRAESSIPINSAAGRLGEFKHTVAMLARHAHVRDIGDHQSQGQKAGPRAGSRGHPCPPITPHYHQLRCKQIVGFLACFSTVSFCQILWYSVRVRQCSLYHVYSRHAQNRDDQSQGQQAGRGAGGHGASQPQRSRRGSLWTESASANFANARYHQCLPIFATIRS